MARFKITGNHTVAGKNPGDFVTDNDLEDANVDALVEGGHLEANSTTKKTEE